MSKESLSAKQVQHAKPSSKRTEIPAGPPSGLYLVVHPTGRKGWALRYRWYGITRNLTFTKGYPDLSLSAARAEAQSKLDDLDKGIDPAAVQTEEVRKEAPNTAKAVAEEWLKREVEQTRTHPEVKRILTKEVFPSWKHQLITDIDRPGVMRLLDTIVDRGAPVLANRTLSILKRMFRWTEERGYVPASPVAGIRPPTAETTRDRVLTDEELAEIWNTAPSLGYPFGDWIRFLILTAQRRSEAAEMRWQQVQGDLWTLPREATKAGRIHDVPLSTAAVKLLKKLPRFKEGDFVFTTQSGAVAISGFSKAKALIDKAINEKREKLDLKPLARWTYHDLRRTAATWMAGNKVPPHVLAAILNHTPGSTMGITAIYARHRHSEERRAALQSWAEHVVSLESPKRKAKATA